MMLRKDSTEQLLHVDADPVTTHPYRGLLRICSTEETSTELQAVIFDTYGRMLDAVFSRNTLAIGCGVKYEKDSPRRNTIYVNLDILPNEISLILFVVVVADPSLSMLNLKEPPVVSVDRVIDKKQDVLVAPWQLEREHFGGCSPLQIVLDSSTRTITTHQLNAMLPLNHVMDELQRLRDLAIRVCPNMPDAGSSLQFNMLRGNCLALPQTETRITIAVGWAPTREARRDGVTDIDASGLIIDAEGDLVDKVYFKQLSTACGALQLSHDNLTGRGRGDDESMTVNLGLLPRTGASVALLIHLFSKDSSFANIKHSYCRLFSPGQEYCRFNLSQGGSGNGLLMGLLTTDSNGRWFFYALGIPCNGRYWRESLGEVQAVYRNLKNLDDDIDQSVVQHILNKSSMTPYILPPVEAPRKQNSEYGASPMDGSGSKSFSSSMPLRRSCFRRSRCMIM